MEFRVPFLQAMQEQNLPMYRRLKASGELERFVQLKANEAHRLFLELTKDAPKEPSGYPSQPFAREAEEQIKAALFEFPNDSLSPRADEQNALFHETPPQG